MSEVPTTESQAVDENLGEHAGNGRDWSQQFDELVARRQSRQSPDVTAEAIEADITVARAEVRQARRAARAAGAGARRR